MKDSKDTTVFYHSIQEVNLRKEASANSNIIRVLSPKDDLIILDSADNWYKVNDQNSDTGYVSKKYITQHENIKDEGLGIFPWLLFLLFIYIIYKFLSRRDKIKKCAWCNSRNIKFIAGDVGSWHWEYRNKDGSKDKRVKGNQQEAGYTSKFSCKNCDAETEFKHYVNSKPSKNIKAWRRQLLTEGTDQRSGTDFESNTGVKYNSSSANRKGKV
jgi:uncharacterized protein YgiM (DUF1202 family)